MKTKNSNIKIENDNMPTQKQAHLQTAESRHTRPSLQKSLLANALRQTQQGRTANKVLPKAGLNGFDWTFVQGSTFVLRLNFSAKNSRLRKAAKRCEL